MERKRQEIRARYESISYGQLSRGSTKCLLCDLWFYYDQREGPPKICNSCIVRIQKTGGPEGVLKVMEEIRINRRDDFYMFLIFAGLGLLSGWAFMTYVV